MASLSVRHAEAKARFERGDTAAALAAFEGLAADNPRDPEVLSDLATVCFVLGRHGDSCSYYARALELDPGCAETRRNLELACRACGVPVDAVLNGPRPAGRQRKAACPVCPCCGGSNAEFLPAGGRVKKPGRKCPQCGSLERHRALWLYMLNRTNLARQPVRLLHFAPMPALKTALATLPNVTCITADLESPRAMIRMDITDNLFRDDCFDAVLCVHVLEHVADDRRAMREVRRVLKPGGWAILHAPVDWRRADTLEDPAVTAPEDRERLYGQNDHVRAYGRDYADRLAEAGFEVTVDDYVRRLGAAAHERHRLGSELMTHFCVKPVD